METVSLSFRYAEEDYVGAMRTHYARRLRLPLDIAVIVGVAVLGAYELRSGSRNFGIGLLGVSIIFTLLLISAFTLIPKVAFRREPKFRDDYNLEFSPLGIHFRTVHIDSNLQWSLYTSALVDAHSFILYYGAQQFSLIPKRVFRDVSQRQAFERLLADNVRNIVDRTK